MFGVAASLRHTVLVLEARGGTYGGLAALYGELDPNGGLRRSSPRGPGLPESIEALYARPLEWALGMVAVDPRSYSVLRYDPDAWHFDPFLFDDAMLVGGGALDTTSPDDPVERRLAQFGARWEDQKQKVILGSFLTREKWMDELLEYLDTELRVDAMSARTPGFEHLFARSAHGSKQLFWTSQTVDTDGYAEPTEDEPPSFDENTRRSLRRSRLCYRRSRLFRLHRHLCRLLGHLCRLPRLPYRRSRLCYRRSCLCYRRSRLRYRRSRLCYRRSCLCYRRSCLRYRRSCLWRLPRRHRSLCSRCRQHLCRALPSRSGSKLCHSSSKPL